MKLLVELGRFMLTAIATAIAIPSVFLAISAFSSSAMSAEAFFGIAAVSFAFAVLGGILIGLPALWVAKRLAWDRRLGPMILLGCLAGAVAAALIAVALFGGDLSFAFLATPSWMALGAFAGLVAALVWVLLHSPDAASTGGVK